MTTNKHSGTTSTDPRTALRIGTQTAWVLVAQHPDCEDAQVLGVWDHEPNGDEQQAAATDWARSQAEACEGPGADDDDLARVTEEMASGLADWRLWQLPVQAAPVPSGATQPADGPTPHPAAPSATEGTGEATTSQGAAHPAARPDDDIVPVSVPTVWVWDEVSGETDSLSVPGLYDGPSPASDSWHRYFQEQAARVWQANCRTVGTDPDADPVVWDSVTHHRDGVTVAQGRWDGGRYTVIFAWSPIHSDDRVVTALRTAAERYQGV